MSEYSTMMKQILKLKEINKELNYKLDKIEELIKSSKQDEYTNSVDTGFNIYHNTNTYYLVDISKMRSILRGE